MNMHPASENLHYLRQGIALIRDLDPGLYAAGPDGSREGGVGAHFRHTLDFYRCFLRGLAGGAIDYSRRERETRVEIDADHAALCFEGVADALAALDPADVDRALRVRVEHVEDGALAAEDDPGFCTSSVLRELQFLVSHTVHHYAIIKLHLQLSGMDVSELTDFGVAPSTRTYWRQTG